MIGEAPPPARRWQPVDVVALLAMLVIGAWLLDLLLTPPTTPTGAILAVVLVTSGLPLMLAMAVEWYALAVIGRRNADGVLDRMQRLVIDIVAIAVIGLALFAAQSYLNFVWFSPEDVLRAALSTLLIGAGMIDPIRRIGRGIVKRLMGVPPVRVASDTGSVDWLNDGQSGSVAESQRSAWRFQDLAVFLALCLANAAVTVGWLAGEASDVPSILMTVFVGVVLGIVFAGYMLFVVRTREAFRTQPRERRMALLLAPFAPLMFVVLDLLVQVERQTGISGMPHLFVLAMLLVPPAQRLVRWLRGTSEPQQKQPSAEAPSS